MKASTGTPGINDAVEITNDVAMHGRGSWLTAAVSGLALFASAISLWETTLKQAQIDFYVSENIQYTRDPYGSFEVLAVPVTIVNGGARDGAVLSMQMQVKNTKTGQTERFRSAYTVDAQYFASRDDLAARIKRPKVPFAPLSIPGRGSFTGTVLFYRAEGGENRLIEAFSQLEMTLSLVVPPANNQVDRALTTLPHPVTVKAEVPNFYPGALISGDNAPLKVISGAY